MQPTSLPIVRPKPGEKIKPIRTQARAATILPSFVGLKFQVHNGKVYNDLLITEDMVGHKLGEFSLYVPQPTSFPLGHAGTDDDGYMI
ncbi:ribosomal protein S19/S15 [Apiospora sp. TS-2023a]